MKVALAILFSALTIVSANQVAVDAPPAKPGKIPPEVHGRSKRACGSTPTKMNDAQNAESVVAHNIFRAREDGSNILKVEYDAGMAARAQEWTDQCIWAHGLLTDCNGVSIGQNLFVEANPTAYPTLNVTGVIDAWWSEKKDYDWPTMGCPVGKICGHYTQLVHAKNYKVGCAYTLCPTIVVGGATWKNALYVGCDYIPGGNVKGEQPYLKGAACSNCDPEGTGAGYKCENNLCARCTPATDSACKCASTLACANGSWDASTCTCKCNKGFYGLKCETSCACTDTYDQCAAIADYCTQPDYADYMTGQCRKTCTNLCKPPPSCAA